MKSGSTRAGDYALLVAGVPWYWGLDKRGGGVKEDGSGGQGILINVETENS